MVKIDQIIIGALIPIATLLVRELISLVRGHQERSFSLQKEYFLRKLEVAEGTIAVYQSIYTYLTLARRFLTGVISGKVKGDEFIWKKLNEIKQKYGDIDLQNSALMYNQLYFDIDRKVAEEFMEEIMSLITDILSLKLSDNEKKDPELLKKSFSEIIPKFVDLLKLLKKSEDRLIAEMDKIKGEFKKFDVK